MLIEQKAACSGKIGSPQSLHLGTTNVSQIAVLIPLGLHHRTMVFLFLGCAALLIREGFVYCGGLLTPSAWHHCSVWCVSR